MFFHLSNYLNILCFRETPVRPWDLTQTLITQHPLMLAMIVEEQFSALTQRIQSDPPPPPRPPGLLNAVPMLPWPAGPVVLQNVRIPVPLVQPSLVRAAVEQGALGATVDQLNRAMANSAANPNNNTEQIAQAVAGGLPQAGDVIAAMAARASEPPQANLFGAENGHVAAATNYLLNARDQSPVTLAAAVAAAANAGAVGPAQRAAVMSALSSLVHYPNGLMAVPLGFNLNQLRPRESASYDHLIYAYMIENTMIVEIFRKIIRELVTGERLPIVGSLAQRWVASTEALFFSRGLHSHIWTGSEIRVDNGAVRRNAYYRMFGMDLNHGPDDGRPYGYEKGAGANRLFAALFEELLVQLSIAMEHAPNTAGPNPTDVGRLQHLLDSLHHMLRERRRFGNLYPEEFASVTMMSWLHVAILFDSPIVVALNAGATTADERLRRLGQRVGLAPHPRCREYLILARQLSMLLQWIEAGVFLGNTNNIQQLYAGGTAGRTLMEDIMTNWTQATGRDVRAKPTRETGARPSLSRAVLPN